MSNKKQSKQSNVLLGLPDGEIEVDNDAYASKIGGIPVKKKKTLLYVHAFTLLHSCFLRCGLIQNIHPQQNIAPAMYVEI